MESLRNTPVQALAERQYFLDWLRILAFGLLVPYHVGLYYVSDSWHVVSPTLYPDLEPLLMLSSPWRLCLLFLVAGAASATLWQGGSDNFAVQRSRRLLGPLLFGMLVIVPPQVYAEVVQKLAYAGSYVDFMALYLRGHDGFCPNSHCLTLPAWNHLWFIAYLWAYSMIGWAMLRAWPAAPRRFAGWLQRHRNRRTLLLTLALPLVAASSLVGWFPPMHDLMHDLHSHAQYLPLFLLAWVAARSSLWDLAAQHRRLALALAVSAWLLVALYHQRYQESPPPDALRWSQGVLYGAMQWWCLMAACGYARHHLNRDHPWRTRLNQAVYCCYILHQTLIVLLAQALWAMDWPVWVEGVLLIAGTLALCGVGYALARRVPVLHAALGISGAAGRNPGPDKALACPASPSCTHHPNG